MSNNEFTQQANVEYLYRKADAKESAWQLIPENDSSFKLVLNAGNNYDLLVRYAAQKETIAQYTITVKPHFWQTITFKIIIALLILCVAFYMYIQRKKIQHIKAEAAQQQSAFELKSIQAQLNPHFIFNALSSIQGLMNTGKIDEANQYLSEFSMLMRDTLNDNDKTFSTIAAEIKKMEQYLNLEQLRFRFAYNIAVAEAIDKSIEIPTLLLQPIVENAIKHGVGSSSTGKLEINFTKKDNSLLVTISDNGNGFNPTTNTAGYGLKLTAGRIKRINSLHKENFIEQKTTSSDSGTLVTIIFNQWL